MSDLIEQILEVARNSIVCDDSYSGADIDEDYLRKELKNILGE